MLDSLVEEYPEIEAMLAAFDGSDFQVRRIGHDLVIDIPGAEIPLKLTARELNALNSWKLPSSHRQLRILGDYGLTHEDYSEVFIELKHPKYSFLDTPTCWPASAPLRFRIADIMISVGNASPLSVLIMEPHFQDSDLHPEGFARLASVRMVGPKHDLHGMMAEVFFYLNSHYLKPVGCYATVYHVAPEFEDPLELYGGASDPVNTFAKIARRRVRTRRDHISSEPLRLYNYGCRASGTAGFLSLYRVLEFFFHRSTVSTVEAMRHDSAVNAEAIIAAARRRYERYQLTDLLKGILTRSQTKKLVEYASAKCMTDKNTLQSMADSLYEYRNSIVHAKESEITKTIVPDGFAVTDDLARWTYIVKVCAERAIRVHNESTPVQRAQKKV